MARTFNGNIWGGIGNAVSRDAAMRRQEKREALGGLLDMAKFLEKANANRNLRESWQKYFEDRKAAEDTAAADMVDDALAMEELAGAANDDNIFGIEPEQAADEMAASIWGGLLSTEDPVNNVVRFGFDPVTAAADAEFMQAFDPNTATPEDIRRAQGIVGTGVDGRWGKKSRAAYNKYMGV